MLLIFPSKILVIHAGGIGDLLLALPALRAFRSAFPDSSLDLLGFPERLSLVAHDLRAASIHPIDQAGLAHFYLEGGVLPPRFVDFFSSFSAALLVGRSRAETLAQNLRRAGLNRVILLPFPEKGKHRTFPMRSWRRSELSESKAETISPLSAFPERLCRLPMSC